MAKPNFEKIIYHLEVAKSYCGESFKSDSIKPSINLLIGQVEKLKIKDNKKEIRKSLEKNKEAGNKYKNPVESIKVLDSMIEEEKRENL